jgi:enamine deaminase RidA (YjgF/YER057c/UK114 family)
MAGPHLDRVQDCGGHEDAAGYSRAARRSSVIAVSGTTANDGAGGALHRGDTGAQTVAALRQAIDAVERLGGRIDDVVRTRVYLAPGADWPAAARAHAEVFGTVRPANTMLYVHALIGDDFLVEVELDAVVDE